MKTLVLACILALAAPGCAAVMAVLPAVVSIVTDAMLILDQIEDHVRLFFKSRPDAETEAKVQAAVSRARAALVALNRTAQGVEAADDQRLAEAFAAFREAYEALLEVVAPFGVQTQPGGFAIAQPGVLYVPQPLALQPRLR